jgi:hypothetical protein
VGEESMMQRRTVRTFFTTTVAALALIGGATRAAAQVQGNPFLIDGFVNETNNSGIAGGFSVPPCDSTSPQACKQNDPHLSAKELGPINGSGTKIGPVNLAPVPMLGPTNPNAQVDLSTGWTQSKLVSVNGAPHIFFYFGWRRDSSTGSGFLSIEVEKAPVGDSTGTNLDGCKYDTSTDAQLTANCNPFAGRQAGDFVLLWDQQGQSRDIIIAPFFGAAGFGQALEFPDCSHGDARCVNLTTFGCAEATFSSDGFSGEMAVDLTCANVFSTASNACETFANIIPGTVTGNSNTADYKDVILAPFPPISNCGIVTVTKVTVQPDGVTHLPDPDTVFHYILKADDGNAQTTDRIRFDADALNHSIDGAAPQTQISRDIKDGVLHTHTDLIPLSIYTLVEDPATVGAYALLSITCNNVSVRGTTFAVAANTTTACVITNEFNRTTPAATSFQTVRISDLITIGTVAKPITPGGANLTGGNRNQIVLSLYSDPACTTLVSPTLPGSNPQTLALAYNGAGTQASTNFSVGIDVNTSKTVYWAFTWDGDTLNFPLSTANTCADPHESLTVIFSPAQP